ncbi:MAG: transglutaminase-like domain-containing protein [Pseudomonadota bacterium]
MDTQITERLQQMLVADQDLSLAEAALLLAKDEYPGLDVDAYLARLDELATRVRVRLPEGANIEDTLVTMNQILFDELGFAGNVDDYYDPRNSFLNDVLDRKLGIPITLSILYMDIASRLGLELEGVSFPGHFLVKFSTEEGDVVLDPFSGGTPLTEEDLVERLEEASGNEMIGGLSLNELLEATDKRDILVRMLRNLKGIYLRRQRHDKALTALHRILQIAPDQIEELRERGELHERLECYRAARDDYRRYLERANATINVVPVRTRLIEVERQLARYH